MRFSILYALFGKKSTKIIRNRAENLVFMIAVCENKVAFPNKRMKF